MSHQAPLTWPRTDTRWVRYPSTFPVSAGPALKLASVDGAAPNDPPIATMPGAGTDSRDSPRRCCAAAAVTPNVTINAAPRKAVLIRIIAPPARSDLWRLDLVGA